MKKMILVLALAIWILTGCSVKKVEQPPTEAPTQAVIQQETEPATVATEPTKATEPETTAPPATETEPPATTAPTTPPAIVITKNPTSETVSVGGRTWFIANAENETQITWEFFSPDGTMYSLQQTMSAHPGLILEALPDDTLGLRQIPASFSGWSARARYDGPGGTATTERATITVRDPYGEIIEAYRTVHRTGTGNIEKGISELVNNYHFLGYAMKDLDGNGVSELILASDGNNDYPYVIYEIYTLQNGNAVSVTKSAARSRFFMLSDGRFLLEGSSGAMNANWMTYTFSGSSLALQEQIWTSEEPHTLTDYAPYYYYATAYAAADAMTDDEATRTIESWEWAIVMPTLTPIN